MTSATYNRRRLFQVPANAELFIEMLQHYRREGNYKLHAFVAMPEHIHLLLTPTGITLERAMGLIKGGFSHRIGSKFPVWQRALPTIAFATARSSLPGASTSTRIPSVSDLS